MPRDVHFCIFWTANFRKLSFLYIKLETLYRSKLVQFCANFLYNSQLLSFQSLCCQKNYILLTIKSNVKCRTTRENFDQNFNKGNFLGNLPEI